jgi:hypothetical protein
VLEILGHGEAEARAFVIGMVFGAPALSDAPEPADSERLAVSFRALALALCLLLARRFAPPGAAGQRADRLKPAEWGRLAASAPDTS